MKKITIIAKLYWNQMAAIRVENELVSGYQYKKVLDRVVYCHLTCSVYTVKTL